MLRRYTNFATEDGAEIEQLIAPDPTRNASYAISRTLVSTYTSWLVKPRASSCCGPRAS